jgi:hypothetical protein
VPEFNADRRAAYLAARAAGQNVEQACASAGVCRATVSRWRALGRAGSNPDTVVFLAAERALRDSYGDEGRVSDEEIERRLERGVREGSLTATRALLRLRDRRMAAVETPARHPRDLSEWWRDDPFLALEPDLLAAMTVEQRERAVQVCEQAHAEAGAARGRRNGRR